MKLNKKQIYALVFGAVIALVVVILLFGGRHDVDAVSDASGVEIVDTRLV